MRARLEPADLVFKAPYYRSIQQHGLAWAPLEVIRDEADAVLFWGANPIHSAPRQVVRYAVFARGRFTERGIEDRQVAAAGTAPANKPSAGEHKFIHPLSEYQDQLSRFLH